MSLGGPSDPAEDGMPSGAVGGASAGVDAPAGVGAPAPAGGDAPARPGGIALLPLDERPVNTALPRDVAAVAGVDLALPPPALLPRGREPGDVEGLADWLRSVAGASSIGVCLDGLVHGGLIAARTGDDPVEACLHRLSVLTELSARRPRPALDAVSVVTRAADSDDAGEEPAYWSSYGRRLHRMGALLHESFDGDAGTGPAGLDDVVQQVPSAIRRDFEHRRLRNHIVNLEAVDLRSQSVLDTLLITADDTAGRSAGSLEQRWIRHWVRALDADAPSGALLMYPGADEVGCTLVARGLHRLAGGPPVRIAVASALPADMSRVPPFENEALAASVPLQIRAAGAQPVTAPGWTVPGEPVDVVLVVHPAAERPLDATVDAPPKEGPSARATVDLVGRALATGAPVVVADARYANGADPALVDELTGRGLVGRLTGYAGWNTAGNTVGSAVGVAVAAAAGSRLGSGRAEAGQSLLVHRLLEDDAYQARGRRMIRERLGLASTGTPFGPGQEDRAVAMATGLLNEGLARLGLDGWRAGAVRFPWHRTFEIDFEVLNG